MKLMPFVFAAILVIGSTMLNASTPSTSTALFKPTLERWDQHPGPGQQGTSGDYWEKVPRPEVRVVGITRGTAKPGRTLKDAGIITLEVSLPETSTYSVDEFGVYFRVESGKLPDEIFPDCPLIGQTENGKQTITLHWLDGHPSRQIDLDLRVEVFLVTNDLSIGPSTLIDIKSKVRK